MTFSDRIKELNFPVDEFIVVGSGLLDVLGLRAAVDVDITASPKAFASLEDDLRFEKSEKRGHLYYRYKDGDVEVWPYLIDWVSDIPFVYETLEENSVVIDGIRYISPQFLLMWKRRANREKDKTDIDLLSRYVRGFAGE